MPMPTLTPTLTFIFMLMLYPCYKYKGSSAPMCQPNVYPHHAEDLVHFEKNRLNISALNPEIKTKRYTHVRISITLAQHVYAWIIKDTGQDVLRKLLNQTKCYPLTAFAFSSSLTSWQVLHLHPSRLARAYNVKSRCDSLQQKRCPYPAVNHIHESWITQQLRRLLVNINTNRVKRLLQSTTNACSWVCSTHNAGVMLVVASDTDLKLDRIVTNVSKLSCLPIGTNSRPT